MILRVLNLLVIGVLVLAAAYVYRIKFDATVQAERLAKLRGELRHERDKVAALRAQWEHLDNPTRIEELVISPVITVFVLDDASHLNIGQRERLLQDLDPVAFDHGLLIYFSIKWRYRSIRANGPRVYLRNLSPPAVIRQLDSGILLAFFAQNLHANVVMGGMFRIVPLVALVQDHGRGSGFRVLQLFRRDWLPFIGTKHRDT